MMFNSPLEFCAVIGDYVALDQTQRECASANGCAVDQRCPLATLFAPLEPPAVRSPADTFA